VIAKKARITQAVEEEIAAILRRSEGVFLSVKRRKNGKLPRGSVMINRGTRIVIRDANVCMMTLLSGLRNALGLQGPAFLKSI
jgi:hypothetical protein